MDRLLTRQFFYTDTTDHRQGQNGQAQPLKFCSDLTYSTTPGDGAYF